jgi:hypothetical protein
VTSGEAEGVSIQDAPAQASEGGAEEVESSADSGPLQPPKPSQDAHDVIIVNDDSDVEDKGTSTNDILDEAPTITNEGPLSAVTEESVLEDAPTSTHVKSESPPDQVALPPSRESSLGTPPSRVEVDLTSDTLSEAPSEWMGVEQTNAYVAEQVTRWERVVVEHVASPAVYYDWPIPAPDFRKWWVAMTATTEFVTSRMSDTRHPESWIAEWQLVRLGPNTVNDLRAITVSPSTLSARECAALLQTLFFEAGFRFRNLIPEWFRARASRMNPVMIRSVTETLQHLLAVELLEWRTVTTGLPSRIGPESEALTLKVNQDDDDPDINSEDQDGDLIMSPYEAEMLGRDYIRNLTRAGVRPTRSPTSSYTGEPESKRRYLQPSSMPSLGSHLSIHSLAQFSQNTPNPSDRMSVSQGASSRRSSDIFGLSAMDSEESARSATSGSRSSRAYSSSASSMWSAGGGGRMPYAGASGTVMTAQGGETAIQDIGSMGVQITQTTLPSPPMHADLDDVVMAESGRASIRSGHRSRTSRRHARSKKSSSSESSSESSSDDERRHRRRGSKRHDR